MFYSYKKKNAKKLDKKQLEITLSALRILPGAYRNQVSPLVKHVYWLQLRVEELESEVRSLRQESFLIEKQKIEEKIKNPPPPPEPPVYTCPGERTYNALRCPRTRSAYLKLSQRGPVHVYAIANSWAKENGKELLYYEEKNETLYDR
jgi:hypothetical protein